MTGGNGWIWPLSARDLIAVQQRLGPAKPGSDERGAAGEHGGMALPRHDAVSERTCRARNCCLWPADVAEAVFVDAARGEEVQFIHHVVMTTYKRSINPGRFQYR